MPEHISQEDGTRDKFMEVWHSMDKDDSDDISPQEFVDFCLQLHPLPPVPRRSSRSPMTRRRNSAPYPGRSRAEFSRSKSSNISFQSVSSSRSRSLSPAMRRSVSRMYSDAEFYQEKKERFKEELKRQEEAHLHETKSKWKNDLIRHRITGSPQHHPSRTRSAPRSSIQVGTELYAKDQKWMEVRDRSVETLAATLKKKKEEEEEVPTFKPTLITKEFNEANHIRSLLGNKTQATLMQEADGPLQQTLIIDEFVKENDFFKPKISERSEKLAQKRRLLRDTLDLSHSDDGVSGLSQDEEPHTQHQDSSRSPGSGKKRAKSPALFEHLYEDATRSRMIKEKAAEKHTKVFSFQPDIGQAKYRRVESDQDQFVQRLHDHHRQQEERTEKLREECIAHVTASNNKVVNRKDVNAFLDRVDYRKEQSKELLRVKKMREEQELQEQALRKHATSKSNRLIAAARRKSLEEIFAVLLMSADLAREREKQKKAKEEEKTRAQDNDNARSGGDGGQSWGIGRGDGEEAYEIVPSPLTSKGRVPPPPVLTERSVVSSTGSVVDSVVSNVRTAQDSDGVFESGSEGSPGPPKRNLLHNFLSADVSESSVDSSVLQRVKHQHESVDLSEDGVGCARMRSESTSNGQLGSESSTILEEDEISNSESESVEDEEETPELLDTMLAVPDMLQPKALAEAVAMVMHASKPHLLSKKDFIECFEVLMSSGIAAPLNALLAAPTPSKPTLRSEDREAQHCRAPRLHSGPKSKKLRDQAANNPRRKAQPSSDQFRLEYNAVYARKTAQRREALQAEEAKENTFRPVLFTKNHKPATASATATKKKTKK